VIIVTKFHFLVANVRHPVTERVLSDSTPRASLALGVMRLQVCQQVCLCPSNNFQIQDRTHRRATCQHGCSSSAQSEFGRNRRDGICTLGAVEASV